MGSTLLLLQMQTRIPIIYVSLLEAKQLADTAILTLLSYYHAKKILLEFGCNACDMHGVIYALLA